MIRSIILVFGLMFLMNDSKAQVIAEQPIPSLPMPPKNIAKRQDVKEVPPKPGKLLKKANGQVSQKEPLKETPNTQKIEAVSPPPPPATLRPLTKKTIVFDARRLDEQRFTDAINYIKENSNVRLKLQNTTINPEFAVKILKTFKDAGVIDQIRDIGFVMLPGGDENLILNEKAFSDKILPFLSHLEGLELSCLGVSDKILEALAKRTPHLKSLSLFGVGITDKTVTNLALILPNLEKLHLVNTSITAKSVPFLVEKFPYLRAIGISGQHFKDKDYLALKDGLSNILSFSAVGQKFESMDTVKALLIAMPKIHTLDLSESSVNDVAAKVIAEIPKGLQNLNISETQITFQGLQGIVTTWDLIKLKINNLKGIGDNELNFIVKSQPRLKVFHFSGAYFSESTIVNLILNLPQLIDVTFIPAKESRWVLTEGVEAVLHNKKTAKLQYLHIQANRLPENLRLKLEKDIPMLRIEYAL